MFSSHFQTNELDLLKFTNRVFTFYNKSNIRSTQIGNSFTNLLSAVCGTHNYLHLFQEQRRWRRFILTT